MSLSHEQDDLWNIIRDLQARLNAIERKEQMPIGTIVPYGGGIAPPGYLVCDGVAVPRSRDSTGYGYPELFGVIGLTYGIGDGFLTFNVPNLKDRFLVGYGNEYSLGSLGGTAFSILSEAHLPPHSHSGPVHTHTGPSHTHAGPSHTHSGSGAQFVVQGSTYSLQQAAGGFLVNLVPATSSAGTGATGPAGTGSTGSGGGGQTGSAGSGEGHGNLPPYVAVQFLIAAI